MSALKWIVNEAKKLKKQYPHRFKKWTDYVAQASAIYASKHKRKSPVGKKRKVSGVTKKAAKKKLVKKSVLRKKAVKKSPTRMLHKDTKSHNVNIRVMSGISEHWLKELNNTAKVLKEKEHHFNWHKEMSKNKQRTKDLKLNDKKMMLIIKPQIIALKKHLTQIKKHIK